MSIHWQDKDNFYCSALHAAAQNGHLEVVKTLLLEGAPWNILDSNGKSAGEYAKEGGHKAVYDEVCSGLFVTNISSY